MPYQHRRAAGTERVNVRSADGQVLRRAELVKQRGKPLGVPARAAPAVEKRKRFSNHLQNDARFLRGVCAAEADLLRAVEKERGFRVVEHGFQQRAFLKLVKRNVQRRAEQAEPLGENQQVHMCAEFPARGDELMRILRTDQVQGVAPKGGFRAVEEVRRFSARDEKNFKVVVVVQGGGTVAPPVKRNLFGSEKRVGAVIHHVRAGFGSLRNTLLCGCFGRGKIAAGERRVCKIVINRKLFHKKIILLKRNLRQPEMCI